MKKIAFVLYTNQGFGVSYLKGLPMTRALEKDLKDALKETYSVAFNWEEALKSTPLMLSLFLNHFCQFQMKRTSQKSKFLPFYS